MDSNEINTVIAPDSAAAMVTRSAAAATTVPCRVAHAALAALLSDGTRAPSFAAIQETVRSSSASVAVTPTHRLMISARACSAVNAYFRRGDAIDPDRVRRRDLLGGLIHEYEAAAA